MKERSIIVTSAAGLMAGCILGIAGSFVASPALRSIAWAIDSSGLILAGILLALYFFKKENVAAAGGFLIFAIAETIIFSSCSTNPDNNIPAFASGSLLWALSLAVISLQKIFPALVRITGMIAALLFTHVSVLIFIGQPVDALTKPFPFFAYPFFAATLAGWALTLWRKQLL